MLAIGAHRRQHLLRERRQRRTALAALSQQVLAAVRADREHAAQNGAKPDTSINR